MTKNKSLDGIRGFAVLIVFLSHTAGRDQAMSELLRFNGIGHVGVYLFFVLSGYLLTTGLMNEYQRNGAISISKYFARRFLRIAPLYYLIVTLVFLAQPTNKRFLHIDDGFSGYIRHLFFINGDSVFWTIPVEVSFYLLLPFLVLAIIKYGNPAKYCIALLGFFYFIWSSLVIFGFLPKSFALKIVNINHLSQFLDVFICGALAPFVKKPNQKTVLFIFIFTMLITLVLVSERFLIFQQPFYAFRWMSLYYGVVFSLIILCSNDGLIKKIFESKLLVWMGVVGFSWYLIHFAVIQFVNSITTSHFAIIISFILCGLLSTLLYFAVEKPFITLGKRYLN